MIINQVRGVKIVTERDQRSETEAVLETTKKIENGLAMTKVAEIEMETEEVVLVRDVIMVILIGIAMAYVGKGSLL